MTSTTAQIDAFNATEKRLMRRSKNDLVAIAKREVFGRNNTFTGRDISKEQIAWDITVARFGIKVAKAAQPEEF